MNIEKENQMGTRPVLPLLLSMSFPPMVSMLIQSMYNIVDSIFLASYSREALTAVSLVYPLQNLILAVGVGFGIGINACVSRSLGEKNQAETDKLASNGAFCTAVHGLLFVLAGLFLVRPFLAMFTSDEQVLEMGVEYGSIVMCLAFGSLFHIYIEKLFQAAGNMVLPMFMQLAGAVINIVLDPIFIFGYFGVPSMGAAGAAIATVAGQMAACAMAVILFIRSDTGIHIRLGVKLDGAAVRRIYGISVPAGAMCALPSVMVGILNGILVGLSDAAVAVLGIYIKLQSFVYMPSNGVIQGLRPIVGYCYGARKPERIRQAVRCSMGTIFLIMAAGTALFLGAPDFIMGLFQADAEILSVGRDALRIISLGFAVSTVSLVYAGTFEGLGNGVASLIINLIRQFFVIPPLAFVLTRFMGLAGAWLSFPVAECLAAAVAFWMFGSVKKDLKKIEREV